MFNYSLHPHLYLLIPVFQSERILSCTLILAQTVSNTSLLVNLARIKDSFRRRTIASSRI